MSSAGGSVLERTGTETTANGAGSANAASVSGAYGGAVAATPAGTSYALRPYLLTLAPRGFFWFQLKAGE